MKVISRLFFGLTMMAVSAAAADPVPITLADGSRLTFLDSSAVEWAEGATLQITADLSKSSIRFGTGNTGLTPEQVRQIRVNGHHVELDENGNFIPLGLILIFR